MKDAFGVIRYPIQNVQTPDEGRAKAQRSPVVSTFLSAFSINANGVTSYQPGVQPQEIGAQYPFLSANGASHRPHVPFIKCEVVLQQ